VAAALLRQVLRLGSADLERPDLGLQVGVEIHVDREVARGLVLPELGGGDVALEELVAAELRGQLRGRLGVPW
jgi:hypothetical protein